MKPILIEKFLKPELIDKQGSLERNVRNIESVDYYKNQIKLKTLSYLNFEKKLVLRKLSNYYYLNVSNKPILDAGCGVGLMTLELIRYNRAIFATDFSEESLVRLKNQLEKKFETAKIETDIHLLHGSITSLDFKNDYFSAVISLLTLQHMSITSQISALSEFFRTLEPDGLLLCTVYNEMRFLSKGQKKGSYFETGNPYYSFSRDELIQIASNAGFTDIHVYPMGIFLFISQLKIRGANRFYKTFTYLLHIIELIMHQSWVLCFIGNYIMKINYSDYWIMSCKKPRGVGV